MATRKSQARLYRIDKSGQKVPGGLASAIAEFSADLQTKVFRSAAHAGAIVFYNEMRRRVPVGTGELHDSIYRYHDEAGSTPTRQRYLIGPNKDKAPHWFNVEYGHWLVNVVVRLPNGQIQATTERLADPVWVPGVPYIRPTFGAVAGQAIKAATERAKERLAELKSGGGGNGD